MDFFQHQDRARRSTGRLVALMGAAVVAIIPAVYLVVMVALQVSRVSEDTQELAPTGWWHPGIAAAVSIGVCATVFLASLTRTAQLRGGGAVVAESMGGRPISFDTTDPDERKILNVVEEMAIAAGVANPPVYIMDDERSINAFAAGFSPKDAVIGVTRGCVQTLSRDELQGVMAHEFSHILNGDMRLNIRLMGIVFGIGFIGLIGHTLFRIALYSGAGHRRSKEGGNPGAYFMVIGIGLIIVGAVGSFFGSMIRASVSRQREFLADASAVQFTRNPDGIGGALKKIAAIATGSKIKHPGAGEASHMFFGQAVSAAFATHPPLPIRIRRIQPSWDGSLPEIEAPAKPKPAKPRAARRPFPIGRPATSGFATSGAAAGFATSGGASGGAAGSQVHASPAPIQRPNSPAAAIASVGAPTQRHRDQARAIINRIPALLRDAAREPFGARAVVYALLLDEDDTVRRAQFDHLETHGERGMARETFKLFGHATRLKPELRLPLLDLAIGSLRRLSPSQHASFRENVAALIRADNRVSLFEWMLDRILARHLDAQFVNARPKTVHHYSLAKLGPECSALLSILASVGSRDEHQMAHALAAAQHELQDHVRVELLPRDQAGLRNLAEALDTLDRTSPKLRKVVLEACAACVADDGVIKPAEGELLRAIADDLNCPMPPLQLDD